MSYNGWINNSGGKIVAIVMWNCAEKSNNCPRHSQIILMHAADLVLHLEITLPCATADCAFRPILRNVYSSRAKFHTWSLSFTRCSSAYRASQNYFLPVFSCFCIWSSCSRFPAISKFMCSANCLLLIVNENQVLYQLQSLSISFL